MNYLEMFDLPSNDPVNNLTDIELSYIAGIIDGEGCITIIYVKNSDSYSARLKLQMSDNIIIPWLANKLMVKYYNVLVNNPYAKDALNLTLTGKSGVSLIIRLLPYLRLKNKQADIFLRFITAQFNKNKFEQVRLYESIRLLNKLGV